MIVLNNVTKKHKQRIILQNVSLTINPGEFVCITGPSGAGKSTLLSLLVGAQDVSDGSILVDNVNLRTVPAGALQIFRRRVGIVFQDYKLLQNRTVAENIAFPLEVCGIPDDLIQKRVDELLSRVNLMDRAHSLPYELSGGEKARVAIARAIVHKPFILLADEPTGNIDKVQATSVLSLFQEIHREGTTIIFATHDPDSLQHIAQHLIRLEKGKIVQDSGMSVSPDSEPTVRNPRSMTVSAEEETPAQNLHEETKIDTVPEPASDVSIREKHTTKHIPKKKLTTGHHGSTSKKVKITSIHSE
jgi:cell division transport system ATP-binding protein